MYLNHNLIAITTISTITIQLSCVDIVQSKILKTLALNTIQILNLDEM